MFKRYQYKSQYKKLLNMADERQRILNRDSLSTFTFFSANLYNFLPLVPHQQHADLFKYFRFNQWLNGLDVQYFSGQYPLKMYGKEALIAKLKRQPGIICTFHFGAYQLINYLLIKAKIPYVLLVAERVVESWKQRYPQLMDELEDAERMNRFRVINANKTSALKEMVYLLNAGHYLLVYVDGLEGVEQGNQSSLVSIPLLGQCIRVPKGAAYLAHRFNLPIYPVMALRKGFTIEFPTLEPILPMKNTTEDFAVNAALQKLFANLTPYIIHWPEQWENWSQLHRVLLDDRYFHRESMLTAKHRWEGGRSDYGLYRLDKQHFLLQKKGYRSYSLHEKEYEWLLKHWYPELAT